MQIPSTLTTPVLFLVFNRPSTTKIVFESIRQAKPKKLYIAADGARKGKTEEIQKCNEVRAIISNIDWECEVHTLFRDENYGCGKGVSHAITWFFEHEPEGIILEDDCVPNPSFFRYCGELLEYYRDDTRIMEISGNNLRPEGYSPDEDYSYAFSNFNGIWGWATWRRAWKLYDFEMTEYKQIKEAGNLDQKFNSIFERDYFRWVFERTYLFPEITWDYQWEFVKRINSGLTIVPQKNLVINIGFGADATSTIDTDMLAGNLKCEALRFPLKHPSYIMADAEGDRLAFKLYMTNFKSRIKSYIKNCLPEVVQQKIFIKSMTKFIESREKDPSILTKIKQKSSFNLFSWTNMMMTFGEFEIDIELILLPLI